jgi:hypothetical protein
MSKTLVQTSANTATPVMERYVQQSKEWQRFVGAKLTASIERVLRSLCSAAKMAAKQKGMRDKDVDPLFRLIVARVPAWTDEECSNEFSDPPKEIDACIRMAVRAQAIVMALTVSKQCKETIHVPNSQEFFRRVVVDTAGEHSSDVFSSSDFEVRKMLRTWIVDNIAKHILELVPISLFTEEDDIPDQPAPPAPVQPILPPPMPQPQLQLVPPPQPLPPPLPLPQLRQTPSPPIVCDDRKCTLPDGETVDAPKEEEEKGESDKKDKRAKRGKRGKRSKREKKVQNIVDEEEEEEEEIKLKEEDVKNPEPEPEPEPIQLLPRAEILPVEEVKPTSEVDDDLV